MSTISDKKFAECQNLRKALAATKHYDVTFKHMVGLVPKNAKANHPMLNNTFSPLFDA